MKKCDPKKKQKKCKKLICKQKKDQYFFTLPKCSSGKTVGGYCTSKLLKSDAKKARSCKKVHLLKK